MADFSYLSDLAVDEKTAEYPIHEIQVNDTFPVLIVKPMTQANKAYFNAVAKEVAKRKGKPPALNAAALDESRDKDRALFVAHVLVGWKDMVDAKGKKLPFNKQNAEDFITAIPDWMFDKIRAFCNTIANFTDGVSIDTSEVDDAAKN